ncbi:MAG: proton-conducting transporter membrane subunit [Nitrososphaeraceae archaeon]
MRRIKLKDSTKSVTRGKNNLDPLIINLFGAAFASFAVGAVIGYKSKRVSYCLGIAGSIAGIAISLLVLLSNSNYDLVLWQIMRSTSFHFVISSFNCYFLLISCLVWLGTCMYSFKYDDYANGLASLLILTMLSMFVIILSGDAISFMIGWESMTIASFFMILHGKGKADAVRNAAFLFLAFGEVSTVFIMLAFSGMFSVVGNFDLLGIHLLHVTDLMGSWIFITALIGFGLKMGIVPFHMSEWLPIAHSSAPSNASAVLSSTLTLMGVYGFITIVGNLTHHYELWWGWVTLTVGAISALLGALFASVSEHTKGLPAYSTIENNGLIIIAIGVYLLASYYNLALLGGLALVAALYHCFSHSISKASLFLIMGWISKIKGSFDLNNRNPISKTELKYLYIPGIITILSLAAMPPLAGFVSEWMILEALFQSFRFGDIISQIIGTLVGAISALAAGIIIIAMTKAYGFGLLWSGKLTTTGPTIRDSSVSSNSIRISFYYFAVLIVGLGVAAPYVLWLISNAAFQVLRFRIFDVLVTGLLGVPSFFVILSGKPFGGFSPTFTAIFILCFLIVPFIVTRVGTRWNIRRTSGWFGGASQPLSSSDIYNSFGYSTPIRIMLKFLLRTKENIVYVGTVLRPVIFSPEEYFVELEVLDVFKQFYDILAKGFLFISSYTAKKVMPGKLGIYLIYIMAALIFVLLYVLLVVI